MVLDGSHFKAGIKEAEHQVQHFGKDLLGELKGQMAAAFGAGAVIEFGYKVIENIKHIKEMSEQFGLTTDEVQEFGMAAIKSGQNVEFMAKKIEHLNEMRKKAGEHPFGEEAAALKKIGIDNDAVQGPKETAELLSDITEEAMHSSTAANDFFEAFAKGGRKMIPILEEMRKAKGKDNSWMMAPEELQSVYDGINKLEAAKMRTESFFGKMTDKVYRNPLRLLGPGLPITLWQTLLGGGKPHADGGHGEAGEHGSEGTSGGSGKGYYNQDREDQYHANMKAEADLANKIYEIKFKQADKMKQIQMLQEQLVKAKADEAYWEKQRLGEMLSDHYGQANAAEEERTKAQIRQAELQGKIFDAKKINLSYQGTDELARRGQLTGGSLGRASFYDNLGMAGASQSSDIPKKQLSEAQQQTRHLAKIAEQRFKSAIFGQ